MYKSNEKSWYFLEAIKKVIFNVTKIILDVPMKFSRWLDLRIAKKKVILIGVPTHGNLGDQAICLAEMEFLNYFFPEYKIIQIEEEERKEYIFRIKKYITTNDLIFLHGGGNFGDYYLENEELRRRVISQFKSNKIIFFPQTFDFFSETELEKSKDIYSAHNNLHIVLREKQSFEKCKRIFENNLYLCPDIVFFLDYKKQIVEKKKIILCLRRDFEKDINNEVIYEKLKGKDYLQTDTVVRVPVLGCLRKYFVSRKINQISTAKILITDRLHGMIFGFITNTETFVIRNFNHKITSTYETWLEFAGNIHLVTDTNQRKSLYYIYNKDKSNSLNIKLRETIIEIYKEILDCE